MYTDPKNFIGCKHNRKKNMGFSIAARIVGTTFVLMIQNILTKTVTISKRVISLVTSLASDVDFDSLKSLVRVNIVVKRDSLTTRTSISCDDCDYHFVDGDPKYRHPSQYENCEHADQRMVDNQLVCLRCGLRFTGPPPIPFVKKTCVNTLV